MSHQSPVGDHSRSMHSPRATTQTASGAGGGSGGGGGTNGAWKELESVYTSSPMPALPARMLGGHRPFNSMLAYTERMREISRFRHDPNAYLAGESISSPDPQTSPDRKPREVQARNAGPKHGLATLGKGGRTNQRTKQRNTRQNRPLSLDDEVRRPKKNSDDPTTLVSPKQRRRPLSDNPALAAAAASRSNEDCGAPSTDRASKKARDPRRVRINFVSAADLFDLVDFSLRSKGSRTDNVKLSRAEDTLRLIQEADLFRSALGRNHRPRAAKTKEGKGDVDELDKDSLYVHGKSSPQDSPRASDSTNNLSKKERANGDNLVRGGWLSIDADDDYDDDDSGDGQWAKREMSDRHSNSNISRTNLYDSDNEDDDDFIDIPEGDSQKQHNLELLLEKRMLHLQPQKLQFRPKRAKRMRLHRSLLSAIPEDERHRKEEQSAHQDVASSFAAHITTNSPAVPSSSSLAAIRDSRKLNDNLMSLPTSSFSVSVSENQTVKAKAHSQESEPVIANSSGRQRTTHKTLTHDFDTNRQTQDADTPAGSLSAFPDTNHADAKGQSTNPGSRRNYPRRQRGDPSPERSSGEGSIPFTRKQRESSPERTVEQKDPSSERRAGEGSNSLSRTQRDSSLERKTQRDSSLERKTQRDSSLERKTQRDSSLERKPRKQSDTSPERTGAARSNSLTRKQRDSSPAGGVAGEGGGNGGRGGGGGGRAGGVSPRGRTSTLYTEAYGAVSPANSHKVKAQKKFRKLIFLRDQPDFVAHSARYS